MSKRKTARPTLPGPVAKIEPTPIYDELVDQGEYGIPRTYVSSSPPPANGSFLAELNS